MVTIWYVIGTISLAAAVFGVARSFWRHDQGLSKLGTVSYQWLADRRLGQSNDPHR